MDNYDIESSWSMVEGNGQYEVYILINGEEVVNIKLKEEDINHEQLTKFYESLKHYTNDSTLKIGKYKFKTDKINHKLEIDRGIKVFLIINEQLIEFFRSLTFSITRDTEYYIHGDLDFDSNDLFNF